VTMWLRAGVLVCAFGVALCAPLGAAAATVSVTGDAELTAALALALPGDVIQMAPGAYGTVTIAARGGPEADLTLAGEPGASVAGMNITGSTRLVITGLSVAPAGATAYINVASSNGVTFSNLHLDGGAGGAGVAIWLTPDALGVVIKDSTFLHCASPMCIRASSPDVLIEHNVFDELDDSDAVHGFGVAHEHRGLQDVAERSAFLVDRDGTVRGAWRYETAEVPDFDELLSAARAL